MGHCGAGDGNSHSEGNVRASGRSSLWSCCCRCRSSSVHQWSSGLMSSVVRVVLAIWSARVIFGLQQVNFGLRSVWPLAILFGIVTLWIGLQAQSFTPATWHHPLWSTTAETLGTDTSSAISLNPFNTLSGLARLLAYAGIFWISLQYCRRTVRARQVLLVGHIRWFRLRALRSRRPINQIRKHRDLPQGGQSRTCDKHFRRSRRFCDIHRTRSGVLHGAPSYAARACASRRVG